MASNTVTAVRSFDGSAACELGFGSAKRGRDRHRPALESLQSLGGPTNGLRSRVAAVGNVDGSAALGCGFGMDSLLNGSAFTADIAMAPQVTAEWMSSLNIQEEHTVGTVGKVEGIVLSADAELRDISRIDNEEQNSPNKEKARGERECLGIGHRSWRSHRTNHRYSEGGCGGERTSAFGEQSRRECEEIIIALSARGGSPEDGVEWQSLDSDEDAYLDSFSQGKPGGDQCRSANFFFFTLYVECDQPNSEGGGLPVYLPATVTLLGASFSCHVSRNDHQRPGKHV